MRPYLTCLLKKNMIDLYPPSHKGYHLFSKKMLSLSVCFAAFYDADEGEALD